MRQRSELCDERFDIFLLLSGLGREYALLLGSRGAKVVGKHDDPSPARKKPVMFFCLTCMVFWKHQVWEDFQFLLCFLFCSEWPGWWHQRRGEKLESCRQSRWWNTKCWRHCCGKLWSVLSLGENNQNCKSAHVAQTKKDDSASEFRGAIPPPQTSWITSLYPARNDFLEGACC